MIVIQSNANFAQRAEQRRIRKVNQAHEESTSQIIYMQRMLCIIFTVPSAHQPRYPSKGLFATHMCCIHTNASPLELFGVAFNVVSLVCHIVCVQFHQALFPECMHTVEKLTLIVLILYMYIEEMKILHADHSTSNGAPARHPETSALGCAPIVPHMSQMCLIPL